MGVHHRRGRAAVVAVGDVERRQLVEGLDEGCHRGRVADRPELVEHAAGPVHASRGRLGDDLRDRPCDGRTGSVDQEGRPGLRADCLDLGGAVGLLVRSGRLMPADPARVVGRDAGTAHDPGLGVVPAGHPVGVEAGIRVADEHPVGLQADEGRPGQGIGLGGVRGAARGEVDVRAGHVQERVRPPGGHRHSLFAIHDVVGQLGHLTREGRGRAQATDRREEAHGSPS